MNDHAANFGVVPSRASSILKPNEFRSSNPIELEEFGKALSKWFTIGRKVYWDHIRKFQK
jgi:hypothetical protein